MSIVPQSELELNIDDELFSINVVSNSTMQLSNVLILNNSFRNELYDEELTARALEVNYLELSSDGGEDLLLQNSPNPWSDKTIVSFSLAKDDKATINVYDMTGKLVDSRSGDYSAGMNEVEFISAKFAESGIYYYELVTDTNRISRRMILIK